ncbi:protein kinase [Acrocarpospora sp. B8E8]|uniref:serine/threonine-protein kinase n=1 Tax=Acrocarpospora sp. B8E8 TaxID=3153572 RepID=UPI00325D0181
MEPTGAEPLTPHDPPAIGPYRLLGRLGEGGMGTVYLAVAPTGRLVAVKVVKAQFTTDEDFAARFHGEVENARRVASFCTAQVLDNGNTETGTPYMVTEYIAGIPLSRQITQFGALDPGPLHGVALGVAAALAAIHVAGLVHRDLKPANVILSMSGPRVIDFGIARALDATHSFTQSGELLGSPGWWAPEQVRGQEISPWTDIFAWGCLVAYAGSGRHPYGRGDAVTLAARVLGGRPDLGALPAPLNELARRATDPDPFQRPTAQDLLIALVGGAIPEPASMASGSQNTLVATEMLSESWEAPPNVAAEPDATQILARTATFSLPTPEKAALSPATTENPAPTPAPTPRSTSPSDSATGRSSSSDAPPASPQEKTPAESAPSAPAGFRVGAPPNPESSPPVRNLQESTAPGSGAASGRPPYGTSGQNPVPEAASLTAMEQAWRSVETDPRGGLPYAEDSPTEAGKRERTSVMRWLLGAGAVVAALTVTLVVLLTAGPDEEPKPLAKASVSAPPRIGEDVGRQITLGGYDLALIIPQQPRCGVQTHEGATAAKGGFCLVRWSMLNTGGELAAFNGVAPTLIDDKGSEYTPHETSTTLPTALKPGTKVDGVLVFDLPSGRTPTKLSLTDEVEAQL